MFAAEERIRLLYGDDLSDEGVVHVAAVWEQTPGRFRFIEVRPGSPESATDRFVLDLARARADAIVTTGAILRAEPDVTHEIHTRDLLEWRRTRLGKSTRPISLVLSSGRNLDPHHPMFVRSRASIFTPRDERDPIGEVLRYLERNRRCGTILFEVGPGVTSRLYRSPTRVDELLLSVLSGTELAAEYRGGEFPSLRVLHETFLRQTGAYESKEETGLWRFHRFRRRDDLHRSSPSHYHPPSLQH